MKRFAAAAIAVGVVTASCSGGHGASSLMPATGLQPQSAATSTSSAGAKTTRSATSTTAPAGWSTTATQAIAFKNATDLGALSPAQTLTVRVGLQLHNVDGLKQAAQSHARLSPSQVKSQFGPTATDVAAVTSYLQSQGLSGVTVEPNNLIVSASGSAANVAKAFNTSLHSFSLNGATVFANTAPAYVPTSLGGIAIAVLGLNNVKAAAIADFRVNEQGDGLPQVPVVVRQVGLPSPDTAGADEWTLDMTASTGMAGSVGTLYVYATTSLTDSDIALEFNKWVSDDLAQVGNASFGGCEVFPYVDGSMVLDDEIFLEGAVQGQTMFSSTGDTGSFCSVGNPNGVDGGAPLAEYPAASASSSTRRTGRTACSPRARRRSASPSAASPTSRWTATCRRG